MRERLDCDASLVGSCVRRRGSYGSVNFEYGETLRHEAFTLVETSCLGNLVPVTGIVLTLTAVKF